MKKLANLKGFNILSKTQQRNINGKGCPKIPTYGFCDPSNPPPCLLCVN